MEEGHLARDVTTGGEPEFVEYVVRISRNAKVMKGGRRFSFSALVVVGDKKGSVGLGLGKAREVPGAVEKGVKEAKKNMQKVALAGNTISHEVMSKFGAARVFMKPAAPGTGVIAGASVRAVVEAAGVRDVLTKAYGSTNPINLVKATLEGLVSLRTREGIEKLRGVKIE